MTEPIRVLIVDDHPMAREGIREILSIDDAFVVIDEAVNGEEAMEKTSELMPDLILMDINLPGENGLDITKKIKQIYPYIKIVVVTVSDDFTHLFEAIKNGAQGYLMKNISNDSWTTYLQAVVSGNTPISSKLAEQMLKEFSQHQELHEENVGTISHREKEILMFVARGFTNREISIRLEISEYTVKNHLKNLFQKLHLNNRVQLAKYAYDKGYVKD